MWKREPWGKAWACSFASRADSQANAHVEFAPLLLDYATTCKAELDANSLTPAVANELADELHSRRPTALSSPNVGALKLNN